MNNLQQRIKSYGIDTITLLFSVCSVILVAGLILWDSNLAKMLIEESYSSVVENFGSSYLILTLFSFFFLIIISLSKYGNYILGGTNSYPEFTYFSWIGMLFCSGIGGGIIYWSGVEWAYYVEIPQFDIEPYSQESYSLATAYGLFHCGISAWSIYGIPAIALSIAF